MMKIKNNKKKHTLYYNEDQINKLKIISDELGVSMSDLVRLAVNQYIKEYDSKNK